MTADPAPDPSGTPRPLAVRLLGGEPIADRPGWYSALDVAIHCDDGSLRVGGLRTAGWFQSPTTIHVAATDFDPTAVHYWDFGRLLWVGPSARPWQLWSNAEALTLQSVVTLLRADGGRLFLAGPDGRGLPTADELGLAVASFAAADCDPGGGDIATTLSVTADG